MFELQSLTQKKPASFPVDDVVPATQLVPTESLSESLNRRFHRKLALLPEAEQSRAALSPWYCSQCHPLVDAVHVAFSRHYPLRLSPDSVWLVIAQGFSHHINQNAESLRYRLVRHEGRRKLVQEMMDCSTSSLEGAISGFSSQIREATDPVLHETLVCDFSTTTRAIRTASEVVLLDTYSSYFEYLMSCICGIPRITLEGASEDWQRIRARVEVLETFELGWWVSRLRPILDEFVLAAEGRPTREFWQAIYKPKKAYGDDVITGWITDLFPYLGDPPRRSRNAVLNTPRNQWALAVEKGIKTGGLGYGGPGVPTQSFPSGLSSVPVKFKCRDSTAELDLVAGFFAVEQDASDLSLSPVISWCLTEPAPKKSVVI